MVAQKQGAISPGNARKGIALNISKLATAHVEPGFILPDAPWATAQTIHTSETQAGIIVQYLRAHGTTRDGTIIQKFQ